MHNNSQKSSKKTKLALIVTVPSFFVHLINNIKEYEKNNYDVELITSPGDYGKKLTEEHGFKVTYIDIPRDISPWNDLVALIKLFLHFRKNKYSIVHSGTPKAGLLVALAAFMACIPIRMHTFTGQRWATLTGKLRTLLKILDKLVIMLNTQCYADSQSQIDYLVSEGVARKNQLRCLHKGSYGGINLQQFDRSKFPNAKLELAEKFNWPKDIPWLLFVGRITYNKGFKELIPAFVKVLEKTDTRLLVIGDIENINPDTDNEWLSTIKTHPKIKVLPFQNHPEYYFAATDALCLPSHREGFGTVVLEAAAAGICTIGTNIPGLKDAIIHNETGLLTELFDETSLIEALYKIITNSTLRERLGRNAFSRAQKDFGFELIAREQMREYQSFLN